MPDHTTDFVITMEEIERYFIYSIDPVAEVSNRSEKYLLAVIQWLYQRQNPFAAQWLAGEDDEECPFEDEWNSLVTDNG